MKHILFSVFSSALLNVVSLLILVVTAHSYGAAGRGIFSAATAMATLVATLAGFSHGKVINFEIVQVRGATAVFVKNSLGTILALIVGISIVGAFAAFIAYQVKPGLYGALQPGYLVIVFLSLPFFLWQGYQILLFAAVDQIPAQNRINVLNKLLFLVSVFLLLYGLKVSLFCFMAVYSAFNLLQLAQEFVYLAKNNGIYWRLDFGLIKRLFINGAKMHIDTLGALMGSTANTLLINYYLTPVAVGQYSFAMQAAQLLMILPGAVNWYICAKIAALGPDAAWQQQKKMIINTLLVMLGGAIVAYFVMPGLMRAVNAEFTSSSIYFKYLLLAMGSNALITLLAPQWTARGYFFTVSCITIGVGLLQLVVSFYSIPRYGVWGAILSTLIYFFCFLIVNICFFVHIERKARRALTA